MADEATPAGVPVVITLAYNGEDQDHTRIGRLEYHPRSDARRMVAEGMARWPDDPRNVDDRWPIEDDGDSEGDEPSGAAEGSGEPKPLDAMNKTELRGASPAAAAMPAEATRLELLAAARAEAQQQVAPAIADRPA